MKKAGAIWGLNIWRGVGRLGLSLGWLLLGVSCKKAVSVDLRNASPQLVIEGEVVNGGTPQVRLSRSVKFSDPNSYPPVSGADVRVTDSSNGLIAFLRESQPGSGLYTTRVFSGVPGHVYLMQVVVDGNMYAARSVMPRPVTLDSVSFAMNTDFSNKQSINAVVNFQDPPGLGNYYQFVETLRGRLLPNVFVFEDRLSDGRYIQQPLFNDSSYLQKGDTLTLTMNCIDKNIYDYFFTLSGVTSTNTLQTATPANPNTNISGGALGYFSAHTMNRVKVEVY
ncbi:MAG TPA: DUF4249 domain-containing protein [Puia sp.]